MAIDPILQLAFAMHNTRGAYALLLGSGVSRAAQIPTGWEVTLDLAEQLGRAMKADTGDDLPAWYRNEFGSELDYSRLLEGLTSTPSERQQLLRRYFEPTDDEREEGAKVPTEAHRAIAEMVRRRHVRVIITTNFDRLLETAIDDAGVVPTVISTEDAAEGALPLVHTECTIVKVHGDYLDTRIRNTPSELAELPDSINRLLDRIFDEFGLVVCGWSADWDTGLRAVIERCNTHRFTTFWAARGAPRNAAQSLVQLRRAVSVEIADAETFFRDLGERLTSLDEIDEPHPTTVQSAVATLKRYLPDDRHRIRVHDFVRTEFERLNEALSVERFPLTGQFTRELFQERIRHYESLLEIPIRLISAGCFFGGEVQDALWMQAIEGVGNPRLVSPWNESWRTASRYPTCSLIYAAGIAAVGSRRYQTLRSLLEGVRDYSGRSDDDNNLTKEVLYDATEPDFWRQLLPEENNQLFPTSEYLYEILREPLRGLFAHSDSYESEFDRFECLTALVYSDRGDTCMPIGRYAWKHARPGRYDSPIARILAEANAAGDNWSPFRAGMFGSSTERLDQAVNRLCDVIAHLHL